MISGTGTAQFAFGFYSVMLTSTVLGMITMVLFKPRSWCVYCPMGTMTQPGEDQGFCPRPVKTRTKRKPCTQVLVVYHTCGGLSMTKKNKRNTTERLELNKYCPFCRKHTLHTETK